MMSTENLTMVVSHSGDAAAVYNGEALVKTGHVDDVSEWLLALVLTVEYVDDLVTDKDAGGWAGIAPTLKEALNNGK